MSDKKISALTGATTPLAGTEVLPIVQSGATVKVAVSDLTAARVVDAAQVVVTPLATNAQAIKVLNRATGNDLGGIYFFKSDGTTTQSVIRNSNVGTDGAKFDFFAKTDGGGLVNVASTTVLGVTTPLNFVPATAAKGINFTANTPAAGMTSQLLNWYEEGTWTPGFAFGGSSTGMVYDSNLSGIYRRIGKLVFASAYINLTTKGSGTGGATITGLPFTVNSTTEGCGSPASIRTASITFTGQIQPLTFAGTTSIYLYSTTLLGVSSALTDADFNNASSCYVSIVYATA
jgi:hypothetical protein